MRTLIFLIIKTWVLIVLIQRSHIIKKMGWRGGKKLFVSA